MEVSKFIIDGNEVNVKDAGARNLINNLTADVTTAQNTANSAQNAAEAAQGTANGAVNGLAGKQDAILYESPYTGNIDELNALSLAFCNSSAVTGNLPWSTGFFLIETFKASGPTYLQKAYQYTNNGIPSIAYRMYANLQWYPWKYVTLS